MAGVTAALIGGGAAIAGDAFKFFQGNAQKKQAAQIAKNNPFVAEQMPAEVLQATNLARENYTNGMPGMAYAQQQIDRNKAIGFANAAKGASSGGDLADAAAKGQYRSDVANQNLAMQAASYKSNALGGYEAALGTQAGWQDKLYQNNTLQPYLRAANTAASLQGAGSINESNAIDGAITGLQAGAQDISNGQYANLLNPKPKTMGQLYGNPYLDAASQITPGITPVNTAAMIPYANFLQQGG